MIDSRAMQGAQVRIVRVAECEGRRWFVSPEQRTIYYLASLPPAEVAQAIMQAVHALAEHDDRPRLRLVHSINDARATG